MTVLDLNQEDVGKYLRLDQSGISRRLSGKIPFTLHELVKLDRLLGLDDSLDTEEQVIESDHGGQLLQEMYAHLSKEGRSRLLFVAEIVGENQLVEPVKSEICQALRLLSHVKFS